MGVLNIEWTIANFSCWNSEVHGPTITSPTFHIYGINRQFELFDNSDGNLEVKVTGKDNNNKCSGDVSLISSNGSVICTEKISEYCEYPLSLTFPGLNLRNLVAQIRENETNHQDELYVHVQFRYRLKNVSLDIVKCIRTTIEVHKICVKIASEKFDELIEGKSVPVIRFPLTADNGVKVQIELHESDNTYSSILEFFSTSERKVLVSIRTSVLNKDDAVLKTIEDEPEFIKSGEKKTLNSLTKEQFKENHCSLLINLKIIPPEKYQYSNFHMDKCIYLKSGSFSFVSLEKSSNNPKPITSSDRTDDDPVAVLSKELMCLFQNQDFSDLQLKCAGVTLPVHRAVLSARSPVFKRLLLSDMREAASGSVDIEDLDTPTLARFLAFIYTGAVGEDLHVESALNLYYAADKYEVPSLKNECVSVLSAGIAVSNVCDILSFADRHQDDRLTSLAHDFILRNYYEVLESSEWESFMNRESLLAVKTLTVISRERRLVKASTS